MVKLFTTHIRPLLEFGSPVWNTGYVMDLTLLESVQRRWTKQVTGLGNMTYDQRLKTLDLYSVKGRLLRADIIKCWKIFHGMSGVVPTDIFLMAPLRGTIRGHKFKIFVPQASCEARHRFFSVRVVRHWNALPAELAETDNLSTFKRGLSDFMGDDLFDYS